MDENGTNQDDWKQYVPKVSEKKKVIFQKPSNAFYQILFWIVFMFVCFCVCYNTFASEKKKNNSLKL